jgi:hypothetical protein
VVELAVGLMTAFLKQFEIGRPQIIAACLLLALLLQAVLAISRAGLSADETQIMRDSVRLKLHSPESATASEEHLQPADIRDSILLYRVVGLAFASWNFLQMSSGAPDARADELRSSGISTTFQFVVRFPFALFGVWLGGALWWVSRRLFGNPGGYVALLLFCFSPWVVAMSSRVNADIIAAWGFFGVVYTAIGVAHTLYAPPRSWPPRILLLGVAFGFAISARFLAGLAGVILALAFMLYLTPGRRRAAIAVLAASLAIAALFLWTCYGFSPGAWRSLASGLSKLGWTHPQFLLRAAATAAWSSTISTFILVALEMASLYTIMFWPRARYFGNTAPWTVWAALAPLACLTGSTHADPMLWALPFIFLFVGGMSADWLESRRRRPALIALCVFLSVYAAASIFFVILSPRLGGKDLAVAIDLQRILNRPQLASCKSHSAFLELGAASLQPPFFPMGYHQG